MCVLPVWYVVQGRLQIGDALQLVEPRDTVILNLGAVSRQKGAQLRKVGRRRQHLELHCTCAKHQNLSASMIETNATVCRESLPWRYNRCGSGNASRSS